MPGRVDLPLRGLLGPAIRGHYKTEGFHDIEPCAQGDQEEGRIETVLHENLQITCY